LLRESLAALHAAFDAHVEFAEGAGGLFEELIEESPTEAAPEVDRLKRDHETIAGTMERVEGLLGEGIGFDDERLVEATSELVRLVAQRALLAEPRSRGLRPVAEDVFRRRRQCLRDG